MTNLKIEIAIEGEKQVAAVFADLEKEVSDLRKPLGKIKQHLIKVWQQNFQSEGSKLGKKWKKLSPEYARQKAKRDRECKNLCENICVHTHEDM